MIDFFKRDETNKSNYAETIKIIASLSKLFSENQVPFLHYRIMENLFCSCFGAENLSRSDTAFDAKIEKIGIGLKTFICEKTSKIEKVAEFNKKSKSLKALTDKRDLSLELARLRNERIQLAKDLYGIENSFYHIIARTKNKLIFFETDYEKIDISNIRDIKNTDKAISFFDGQNEYSFNHSKSVLQRKFHIPQNFSSIDIKIAENPFEILLGLKDRILNVREAKEKIAGIDFVILPLFSLKGEKHIPEKSGLNQFNAGGRKRDINEMYIPVPKEIHTLYPNFFPPRDTTFILKTPIKEELQAKLCQDNSKALMSNPNKALANWLLRKILKLKAGELATLEKLENLGFDSVIINKEKQGIYNIDIMPMNSYEEFILKN